MGTYTLSVPVRFGACDPVGIAYFPRYFDWFHQTMEAWFGERLGLPYHDVLRHHGFPAVHSECDYAQPCAFGETVSVELSVGDIGRSSVRLNYRVLGPSGVADVRATGHTVVVCFGTNRDAPSYLKPVALPDTMRAAMLRFQGAVD